MKDWYLALAVSVMVAVILGMSIVGAAVPVLRPDLVLKPDNERPTGHTVCELVSCSKVGISTAANNYFSANNTKMVYTIKGGQCRGGIKLSFSLNNCLLPPLCFCPLLFLYLIFHSLTPSYFSFSSPPLVLLHSLPPLFP